MGYTPLATNDKSQLSEGWHPAYLIQVTEEDTPSTWQMYAKSPRRWIFHFAVWEAPQRLNDSRPEHQTASTSKTFSPGGRYQPSKAYVWACKLLGRRIPPGEYVNPNDHVPLPCRLDISRRDKYGQPKEYADIKDLEAWPEGAKYLTQPMRENLHLFLQQVSDPEQAMQNVRTAPQPTPQQAPPAEPWPPRPAPTPQGAAPQASAPAGAPRW